MKVTHICLASFYIDNHSYQENILPKYHMYLGYAVEIIASLLQFNKDGNLIVDGAPRTYINENGIKTTRLDYRFSKIGKFLRIYHGLYMKLEESKPDIIFIHGCQFLDIYDVIKYIKMHPTIKVFVDNHADFSNSARNIFSKYFLHRWIWRATAQSILRYSSMFYGVLPARVDFLVNIYDIPKDKVDLLVMGGDDELVEESTRTSSIRRTRQKYGFKDTDFIIVTGGKIDSAKKQVIQLVDIIESLNRNNVRLCLFGSLSPEVDRVLRNRLNTGKISYVGWLNVREIYDLLAASDLGIYPGRHSVLWEQSVSVGLPCIFRYWIGTTHVDVGGNCLFVNSDEPNEMKDLILSIVNDPSLYGSLKSASVEYGMAAFSYKQIAINSISIKKKHE